MRWVELRLWPDSGRIRRFFSDALKLISPVEFWITLISLASSSSLLSSF